MLPTIASSICSSLGFGLVLSKRGGRHDLPALTETALGDRGVEPGLLDDLPDRIDVQVVDGGDVLPDHRADRRDATARRKAIDVNGAGAAQAHAAAEFGAVVTGDITNRHSSGMSSVTSRGWS